MLFCSLKWNILVNFQFCLDPFCISMMNMTFQLNILTNGMSITLVLVPHQLLTKSDEKKRYFLEKLKETFLGLGRSIKRWICLINLHALFDRKNSIYGALLNPFLLTFSFIIPFFLITLNGQIQRHVSNAHAINEPTKSCRHCQVAYFSIGTKRPKSSWKLPKMSRFNEQSN